MRSRRRYCLDALILRSMVEIPGYSECLVNDLETRRGVPIDAGKRMDNARLIQTWAIAGVKDFYIGFEFEAENKWHEYSTFFCHQGLEKICKAYILAGSAATWAHLSDDKAVAQANKIAKKLGHNLKRLIGCLRSGGILLMPSPRQGSSSGAGHRGGSYSEDELIEILEAAYIEARYPTTKSKQIHRQYPLSKSTAMFSYPIGETAPIEYARKTASAVLKKIESDFSITIPRDKRYVSSRISEERWRRFERVFFRWCGQ